MMNRFSGVRAATNMEALPAKQMWNEGNYVRMVQAGRVDHWMASGKKSRAGSTRLHYTSKQKTNTSGMIAE